MFRRRPASATRRMKGWGWGRGLLSPLACSHSLQNYSARGRSLTAARGTASLRLRDSICLWMLLRDMVAHSYQFRVSGTGFHPAGKFFFRSFPLISAFFQGTGEWWRRFCFNWLLYLISYKCSIYCFMIAASFRIGKREVLQGQGLFIFPTTRILPLTLSLSKGRPLVVRQAHHERGFLKFPRMKRPWLQGNRVIQS